MVLKLTKKEESAFLAAGEPRDEPDYAAALRHLQQMLSPEQDAALSALLEPRDEPDYAAALRHLQQMLSPEQDAALSALLDSFGALVRYERRWDFHKGYRAGKKETP